MGHSVMSDRSQELWELECRYKAALETIEQLQAALESIAANTCCDKCREAAAVAENALRPVRNKAGNLLL